MARLRRNRFLLIATLILFGCVVGVTLELLRGGGFIEAFKAKGRMAPVLERVPVHVVLNPRVGLIGAALHAAQLYSAES